MNISSISPGAEESPGLMFMEVNKAIGSSVDQICILKPEIALLIEIYSAETRNKNLMVFASEIVSGISKETYRRCLEYLASQGWIIYQGCDKNVAQREFHLSPVITEKLHMVFQPR